MYQPSIQHTSFLGNYIFMVILEIFFSTKYCLETQDVSVAGVSRTRMLPEYIGQGDDGCMFVLAKWPYKWPCRAD